MAATNLVWKLGLMDILSIQRTILNEGFEPYQLLAKVHQVLQKTRPFEEKSKKLSLWWRPDYVYCFQCWLTEAKTSGVFHWCIITKKVKVTDKVFWPMQPVLHWYHKFKTNNWRYVRDILTPTSIESVMSTPKLPSFALHQHHGAKHLLQCFRAMFLPYKMGTSPGQSFSVEDFANTLLSGCRRSIMVVLLYPLHYQSLSFRPTRKSQI